MLLRLHFTLQQQAQHGPRPSHGDSYCICMQWVELVSGCDVVAEVVPEYTRWRP